MKIGMQHWVLEYYQLDQMMSLGFMTRSNLVPYAFVWGEKVKQWIFFFRNICSLLYKSW